MRRISLLVTVLSVLAVVGCQESPTIPSSEGSSVLVYWHMPQQGVVNDPSGNHLQSESVGLMVQDIRLELASGAVASPDSLGPFPWQLEDASEDPELGTQLMAAFRDLESPPVKLHARLRPLAQPEPENALLLEGASVAINFSFNGVIADSLQNFGSAVTQLGFDVPFQLSLPPSSSDEFSEQGARFQVIVDPNHWLFDEEAREFVDLNDLTRQLFPAPTTEGYQEVRRLLLEDLEAEKF